MVRCPNGKEFLNTDHIMKMEVTTDSNGVLVNILAHMSNGKVVLVEKINRYEFVGVNARIARVLESFGCEVKASQFNF